MFTGRKTLFQWGFSARLCMSWEWSHEDIHIRTKVGQVDYEENLLAPYLSDCFRCNPAKPLQKLNFFPQICPFRRSWSRTSSSSAKAWATSSTTPWPRTRTKPTFSSWSDPASRWPWWWLARDWAVVVSALAYYSDSLSSSLAGHNAEFRFMLSRKD